MAKVVYVRLDATSERALSLLRAAGCCSDADAVRMALCEAAARRRRSSVLRQEATDAARDAADLREARAVRAELDGIAVWSG